MRYPQEVIQKVRESSDILGLFEKLADCTPQKSGPATFKVLCPFHAERTPSCNITPSIGRFKCFGCQASGDVIDFVMEQCGYTFTEAIEYLAESAIPPIELPKTSDETTQTVSNRRLKEITAATWAFYQEAFQALPVEHPAKQQIISRKLDPNRPHYGYAPGGNTLTRHLSQTYSRHELSLSGVCGQNSETGELYDFWRDRLIFAITDNQGTPVSFTGRALNPDESRKYVNGKATPIFEKEKLLYSPNILEANKASRATGNCYLAEGQFDVIALYDNGYTNAYATSGTAITHTHINHLQRLVGESGSITYILDGDSAGLKATAAAYRTAPESQANSWAVHLPDNADPCDYLSTYGVEQFTGYINKSIQPLTTATVQAYAYLNDPKSFQTQGLFLKSINEMLEVTSVPATRKLIIEKAAELTGATVYQMEKTLSSHNHLSTPSNSNQTAYTQHERPDADYSWLPEAAKAEYQNLRYQIESGDKYILASRKLLHLALYYGVSPLLIDAETWPNLHPAVQAIYNECVGVQSSGKSFHQDNFKNPLVAGLLVPPLDADSVELTPEQTVSEFNLTKSMLLRILRRKSRSRMSV